MSADTPSPSTGQNRPPPPGRTLPPGRTPPGRTPPAGRTPAASALRRSLARARDGKTLDRREGAVLLHARGDQLAELLRHAARTRDAGLAAAGRPGIITYSKKVF